MTTIRIDSPAGTEIQVQPGMFRMSTAEEIRVRQVEYLARINRMRRMMGEPIIPVSEQALKFMPVYGVGFNAECGGPRP